MLIYRVRKRERALFSEYSFRFLLYKGSQEKHYAEASFRESKLRGSTKRQKNLWKRAKDGCEHSLFFINGIILYHLHLCKPTTPKESKTILKRAYRLTISKWNPSLSNRWKRCFLHVNGFEYLNFIQGLTVNLAKVFWIIRPHLPATKTHFSECVWIINSIILHIYIDLHTYTIIIIIRIIAHKIYFIWRILYVWNWVRLTQWVNTFSILRSLSVSGSTSH